MVNLEDPRQREEFRQAVREAIDEWLDKQFAKFGVWSVRSIFAIVLAGVAYLYFKTNGFSLQ